MSPSASENAVLPDASRRRVWLVSLALILLTLLAGLGHAPELLTYERLHGVAGHWLAKIVAFPSTRASRARLASSLVNMSSRPPYRGSEK